MTAAGRTLRALREGAPDIPTAIVGGHVSALPERTLREQTVDFVIEAIYVTRLFKSTFTIMSDTGNSLEARRKRLIWRAEHTYSDKDVREVRGNTLGLFHMIRYKECGGKKETIDVACRVSKL